MKKLIIFLLLTAIRTDVKAQGFPLYVCDTTHPSIDTILDWWTPFDADKNMTQSIYYKNNFPSMPMQGYITDIFIRTATFPTPAGSKLFGLRVKMGIVNYNDFFAGWGHLQSRSLDSALTPVYYDSIYVLPTSIPAGGWWKLTLPQPYQYSMAPLPGDIPQNLVVQLSKDTVNQTAFAYKFHIYGIRYLGPNNRTASSYLHQFSAGITGTGVANWLPLIGFNGYALSVDDPNVKVPFSVFPNPATDKLHADKQAKGAYEIYSIEGKKVAEGKLKEGEEVDVQRLVPGTYLLKLGERSARFLKR